MFFLFLALSLLSGQEEITKQLTSWPEAFNSKQLEETCALFAPDLIATYPGAPDRSYSEMCRHFEEVFSGKAVYSYAAPKIEQIIVEKDLAVVRLIWTLTVKKGGESETILERGLDVFKRQKDGSWKIAISYAYPESH